MLVREKELLITMHMKVITNDNKQIMKLPTVKFNDTLYNMKADVL